MKPITPKISAKPKTSMEDQTPKSRQSTSVPIRAVRMKTRPPMAGVPALELCHLGPTSRMVCPAFSARSQGMMKRPASSAIRKQGTMATIAAVTIALRVWVSVMGIPPYVF